MEGFSGRKKFERRKGLSNSIRMAMAGAAMLGGAAAADAAQKEVPRGPEMHHEQVETYDMEKEIAGFLERVGHISPGVELGDDIVRSQVRDELNVLMLSASQHLPYFSSHGQVHLEGSVGIENSTETKPVRDALLKKLETFSDEDPRVRLLRNELKILATFDTHPESNTAIVEHLVPKETHPTVSSSPEKKHTNNKNDAHRGASSSTSDF